MDTTLQAVTDADGRPIHLFMTACQVSDDTAAIALPGSLPKAEWLLADSGHDADWHQRCLEGQGDKALHSRPQVSRQAHQARQAPLQTPQPDRDHVQAAQGLAPARHPTRRMSQGLHLRHSPRRNRRVLAMKQERVLTLEYHGPAGQLRLKFL